MPVNSHQPNTANPAAHTPEAEANNACIFVHDKRQLLHASTLTAKHITLVPLSNDAAMLCAGSDYTHRSLDPIASFRFRSPRHHVRAYQLHEWLKRQSFDHVHFPVEGGFGFFALLARHQGLAHEDTAMTVSVDAPRLWHRERQQTYVDQLTDIEIAFMEKRCVELADTLHCDSEEIVKWMHEQAWRLPMSDHTRTTGKRDPAKTALPSISVCLTHYNRAQYLSQTVDALLEQDYDQFEVILVDDGSTDPDAVALLTDLEPMFKERGWTLARQDNQYVGAARNHAARLASGSYLLFMDDDNYAKPHELSIFAQAAANGGADILTCFSDMFEGQAQPTPDTQPLRRCLWLGGPVSMGLFRSLGDANALIRKTAYDDIGGYAEERGVPKDDRQLFIRLLLAGYHMEVIPDALFWYRYNENSASRTDDIVRGEHRILQTYLDHTPEDVHDIVRIAQGLKKSFKTDRLPQHIVDEVWDSPTWRFTRPLRNMLRRLRGQRSEQKPLVHARREALKVVDTIRQSPTWELMGPIRALSSLIRTTRRKNGTTRT